MISPWRIASNQSTGWVNTAGAVQISNQASLLSNTESSVWPPSWFNPYLGSEGDYFTIGGIDWSDLPNNIHIHGVEIKYIHQSFTMGNIGNTAYGPARHAFSVSKNCPTQADADLDGSATFGEEIEINLSYDHLNGYQQFPGPLYNDVGQAYDASPQYTELDTETFCGLGCSRSQGIGQNPTGTAGKERSAIYFIGGPSHSWFNGLAGATDGRLFTKDDLNSLAFRIKLAKRAASWSYFNDLIGAILFRVHYTELEKSLSSINIPLESSYVNSFTLFNQKTLNPPEHDYYNPEPFQDYYNGISTSQIETTGLADTAGGLSVIGSAFADVSDFSTAVLYNSRLMLDINLADLFKERNLVGAINEISSITLNLDMYAEWNLLGPGTPTNPHKEVMNNQFEFAVMRGTWPKLEINENPAYTNYPQWDAFYNPAFEHNQNRNWTTASELNGPYDMSCQYPNESNFDTGNMYKININGDLLHDLIADYYTQLDAGLEDYSLKLVLLPRSQYTYTHPQWQPFTGVYDNLVVLDKTKSSITLEFEANRTHTGLKMYPGAESVDDIEIVTPISGGLESATTDLENAVVNSASIQRKGLVWSTNLLADGSGPQGSITFNILRSSDNAGYIASVDSASAQLWRSGIAGDDNAYNYSIIAHDESLLDSEITTHASNLYPRISAWKSGYQSTGSIDTGPVAGSQGLRFAYTEATNKHHQEYLLCTPNISLKSVLEGTAFLEFYAHMYSLDQGDMGRLFVDVSYIKEGTPGLQDGVVDQYYTQPIYTWDTEKLTKKSLGFESLNGMAPSNSSFLFDEESYGGRIQTVQGEGFERVLCDLNHFVNLTPELIEEGEEHPMIRIQFRAYTRPRESGTTSVSGYCIDPTGESSFCLYDLPNGACYVGKWTASSCNSGGGTWFPITANIAGPQTDEWWKSDIAIDRVRVHGELEWKGPASDPLERFEIPISGHVKVNSGAQTLQGYGTDFDNELEVGQIFRLYSDKDIDTKAAADRWETFRVESMTTQNAFQFISFSAYPEQEVPWYQGSSQTRLSLYPGTIPGDIE